ncbi:MAG: AI-2E family transporter [Chloroflexota bacterium]
MSEGADGGSTGAEVPLGSEESGSTAEDAPAPPSEDKSQPEMRAHFESARGLSGPFWITLLLVILGVIVLMLAASALFVFAVGVVMAFFLVPVVSWIERKGLARWIAAILAVVTTLLAVIAIGLAVVFILVDQGVAFVQSLPEIIDELAEWYETLELPEWLAAGIDAIVVSLEDTLRAVDAGQLVAGVLSSAAGLLGSLFVWFLLPFFLFYLLKDQPRMSRTFYERVPAPWKDDVSQMLTISVGNFATYFKAEFLVGSIMFATVTIGMFAIGWLTDAQALMTFAILLGLIAFVMELIPQIGPILSYIPALILAIPAGIEPVVIVSVFYFIIFNIEGSILVPTFEGKMISFTGATVLVLIAIGFALAGIIGAILALPLASIIRDLFRLFFDKAVEEDLVVEPVGNASSHEGSAVAPD